MLNVEERKRGNLLGRQRRKATGIGLEMMYGVGRPHEGLKRERAAKNGLGGRCSREKFGCRVIRPRQGPSISECLALVEQSSRRATG